MSDSEDSINAKVSAQVKTRCWTLLVWSEMVVITDPELIDGTCKGVGNVCVILSNTAGRLIYQFFKAFYITKYLFNLSSFIIS